MLNVFRAARACGWLTAAAALLLLAGCTKAPVHYTVSGTVTVNGKPPVAGATVVFIGPDNKEMSAVIADDGSYSLTDPPPGDNRIVVRSPSIASGPVVKMEGDVPGVTPGDANGAPIPKKYEDPSTSGLSYTVTRARKQNNDIVLSP